MGEVLSFIVEPRIPRPTASRGRSTPGPKCWLRVRLEVDVSNPILECASSWMKLIWPSLCHGSHAGSSNGAPRSRPRNPLHPTTDPSTTPYSNPPPHPAYSLNSPSPHPQPSSSPTPSIAVPPASPFPHFPRKEITLLHVEDHIASMESSDLHRIAVELPLELNSDIHEIVELPLKLNSHLY
nr:hypothetical protein Iba_chr09fCG12000 [Ipomoea batatas]